MALGFNITSKCNLNCRYCYLGDNHPSESLSSDFIASKIDIYKSNEVYFSGGEPLLHPEINSILHYSSNKGIIPTVFTSGQYLSKLNFEIPMNFCLSFHNQSQFRNALDICKSNKVSVNCLYVLDSHNLSNIKVLSKIIEEVNSIIFLYPSPLGKQNKIIKFSEWKYSISQAAKSFNNHKIFFEPAYCNKNELNVTVQVCPSHKDVFFHYNSKKYTCCLSAYSNVKHNSTSSSDCTAFVNIYGNDPRYEGLPEYISPICPLYIFPIAYYRRFFSNQKLR